MSISAVTSKLLLDESPLVILPSLAKQIGLNESIVVQQMHYWLKKSNHDHDGKPWVYNSISSWQEQFPFWSTKTIERIMKSLKKMDLVETGNYNKRKFDKTTWYTINYHNLDTLLQSDIGVTPECLSDEDKMSNTDGQHAPLIDTDKMSQTIPESTKTKTKSTTDIDVTKKSDTPTLPDWLDKNIWDEWKIYRKTIKKPLTHLAIKRQINTLEKYKDIHAELLGEAIEKGWTNIVTPDKRYHQGMGGSGSYGRETAQERYRKDIASQGPLNTDDLMTRTSEVELELHNQYGLSLAVISNGNRKDWLSYLGPDYVSLPIKHPMSKVDKTNVLFNIDELRGNLYVHLHGREWNDKLEAHYQESNKYYIPLSELAQPVIEKKKGTDEVPF